MIIVIIITSSWAAFSALWTWGRTGSKKDYMKTDKKYEGQKGAFWNLFSSLSYWLPNSNVRLPVYRKFFDWVEIRPRTLHLASNVRWPWDISKWLQTRYSIVGTIWDYMPGYKCVHTKKAAAILTEPTTGFLLGDQTYGPRHGRTWFAFLAHRRRYNKESASIGEGQCIRKYILKSTL